MKGLQDEERRVGGQHCCRAPSSSVGAGVGAAAGVGAGVGAGVVQVVQVWCSVGAGVVQV